jgi:hypothetical protein
MYDALALSMQIEKRPKQEIERALLSRIDFTAEDVPSMLYSAAYLKRFGAEAQAMIMYRQASRLVPTRSEPYVLGLKLAQQLKDTDALGWAASGILTYAWDKNHQKLHEMAEDAVVEAQQELTKAGRAEEAARLESRFKEAKKRDVTLKLTWSGAGDLDLRVDEPAGSVCSYDNPHTVGGGALVHDGYGPDPKNAYEEYVCGFAMPGTYRIRVRHVSGDIVAQRAQLTMTLYSGTPNETTNTMPITISRKEHVVRLVVKHGRRTDLATPLPKEETAATRSPQGLRAKLGLKTPADIGPTLPGEPRPELLQFGAVGYTPVVTTISEGVSLSAMAVVSGDRRFVRLNVVPVFSTLTDVFTFSFINNGNPNGNPGTQQ